MFMVETQFSWKHYWENVQMYWKNMSSSVEQCSKPFLVDDWLGDSTTQDTGMIINQERGIPMNQPGFNGMMLRDFELRSAGMIGNQKVPNHQPEHG